MIYHHWPGCISWRSKIRATRPLRAWTKVWLWWEDSDVVKFELGRLKKEIEEDCEENKEREDEKSGNWKRVKAKVEEIIVVDLIEEIWRIVTKYFSWEDCWWGNRLMLTRWVIKPKLQLNPFMKGLLMNKLMIEVTTITIFNGNLRAFCCYHRHQRLTHTVMTRARLAYEPAGNCDIVCSSINRKTSISFQKFTFLSSKKFQLCFSFISSHSTIHRPNFFFPLYKR